MSKLSLVDLSVMDAPDPTAEASDERFREAYDRAVRLLGQREHATVELERKLVSKAFAAPIVQRVLEELQAQSLQSDARFVEVFVRSRLARGYGPVRIRQDLAQRGVDEILIEEALTQSLEFWLDVAEQSRQKRFGELPGEGDPTLWGKQARFLARRGFPSDVIYRLLGSQY